MPISCNTKAGGNAYMNPCVKLMATVNLKIDVSTLTNAEVDANGYIRPGVIFQADGTRAGSGAGQKAYLFVYEPIKIAKGNTTLATDVDIIIAGATHALINLDIAEDMLERAYSANELAAFGDALRLTPS